MRTTRTRIRMDATNGEEDEDELASEGTFDVD